MRKALFIIIPLIFALTAGVFWWWVIRPLSFEEKVQPENAIPLNAGLVLYYPDMGSTLARYGSMPYYPLLEGISAINGMSAVARGLDSLARSDSEFWELLDHRAVWMAAVPRKNNVAANFVVMAVDRLDNEDFLRLLNRLAGTEASIAILDPEADRVVKVLANKPYKLAFFVLMKGLVMAANDESVLRAAIAQLKAQQTLMADANFAKCVAAAGKNVDAVLMTHHDLMPQLMASQLKPSVLNTPPFNSHIARWSVLDLSMRDDGLSLSGFTYAGDSLTHYLQLLNGQKPQPIDFTDVVPGNVSGLLFFGLSSVNRFYTDYRNYLGNTSELAHHDTSIARINRKFDIDLEIELFSWVEGGFGVCVSGGNKRDSVPDNYAVFRSRSVAQAEEGLNALVLKLEEKNIKQVTDSVGGVVIRRIGINNVLPELLGEVFSPFKETYYMILGQHVIMGTSLESMKRYARHVLTNRVLSRDPVFKGAVSRLSTDFNAFLFIRPKEAYPVWGTYVTRTTSNNLNAQQRLMNEFRALTFQLTSAGNGALYTAGQAYHSAEAPVPDNLWVADLTEKVVAGPWGVRNSVNNEIDFVVQDAANTLHMVDRFGQKVWSRTFDGPVFGEVKSVEVAKKSAYFVCTREKMFLLDREGKDADGFPIEIDEGLAHQPTLVDYDKKRDYRILAIANDGKVLNFDTKGKPVNGWGPLKLNVAAASPLIHAQIGGNDYLAVWQEDGQVLFFDRRGKQKAKSNEKIELAAFTSPIFLSTPKNMAGLYGTDSTGQVVRVGVDGKVSLKRMGRFSANHSFTISELNGDKKPKFVYHDLNNLTIFNADGNELVSLRTNTGGLRPFVLNWPKGEAYMAVANEDLGKFRLVGTDGEFDPEIDAFSQAHCVITIDREGTLMVASVNAKGKFTVAHYPDFGKN